MNIRARWARGGVAAAAAAATLAFGLLAATPAQAMTKNTTAATTSQNCAYVVPVKTTVCAPVTDDLHAAVYQQTGYQVLEAGSPSTAMRAVDGVTPASVFVQAKLFDDRDKGGSFFEVDGGGACTSTVAGVSNIGSSWYGRVSSFAGYSNCRVKVWELTGYHGASYGFYASTNYVGDALNDGTQSVQLVK